MFTEINNMNNYCCGHHRNCNCKPTNISEAFSGKMTEGKKITVQKLWGKIGCSSLDGTWSAYLDSHTQHRLWGTKQRVERSGHTQGDQTVKTLAEEGTQWCFLADKLHSSWKPRENKEDALLLDQQPCKITLLGMMHAPSQGYLSYRKMKQLAHRPHGPWFSRVLMQYLALDMLLSCRDIESSQ